MEAADVATKQAILRKFILTAPPKRLGMVINCLRVLANPNEQGTPAWFEEVIQPCAMEHCIASLAVAKSSSSGLQTLICPTTHLQTALQRCMGPNEFSAVQLEIEQFLAAGFRSVPPPLQSCVLLSTVIDFVRGEYVLVHAEMSEIVAAFPLASSSGAPAALSQFTKLLQQAEPVRAALQEAADAVLLPTLASSGAQCESAVVVCPAMDMSTWTSEAPSSSYSINLSVTRHNEAAMWSTSIASTYDATSRDDDDDGSTVVTVRGDTTGRVHYHECCNVQMESKNHTDFTLEKCSFTAAATKEGTEKFQSSAVKLMKKIRKHEAMHQQQISESSGRVGDSALKALRRKLPVSKQLFDFSEATNAAAAVYGIRHRTSKESK